MKVNNLITFSFQCSTLKRTKLTILPGSVVSLNYLSIMWKANDQIIERPPQRCVSCHCAKNLCPLLTALNFMLCVSTNTIKVVGWSSESVKLWNPPSTIAVTNKACPTLWTALSRCEEPDICSIKAILTLHLHSLNFGAI